MERLLNKVKAAVSRSALLLLSPPTSLLPPLSSHLSPPTSLLPPLSSHLSPPVPSLLSLLSSLLLSPSSIVTHFSPTPSPQCGYNTEAVAHYNGKMQALLKKHNTTPFAPLLGIFLQAPIFIGFYFAITGMAEHMPSFATGGAFWFTDLSTPDPTYLLPLMSSAGILAAVELNAAEGMEGAPNAAQMKWFMRGLAVTMVPLTVTFPKAVFCYWITTNVFSLVQGLAKDGIAKSIRLATAAKRQPIDTMLTQTALAFLKKQLSQTAIGVGAAGTLYCFLGISIQTAISYGIGSAASCLYLLLLFNDTDTIAPEDLPPAFLIDRNKPKRKGLVDSLATVDSPQKLLQGAQLALSSRRLAVPAALVLLWAFSVQFSGSDPNSLHIE
ncbi:unnamed protein product, partial [Closterium sp. NIES-65]